jgi:hypothetical protein
VPFPSGNVREERGPPPPPRMPSGPSRGRAPPGFRLSLTSPWFQKGGKRRARANRPATNPLGVFAPFPEPPPGEEEEGGAGEEKARREADARRRRRAAAEAERVREGPVEEEGDVRVRSGAGPEQRDARRRVHRRRTAKPATPSPSTHGEHRGHLSLLLAPFAVDVLPVRVPSSRFCPSAPRRRLPMGDAASRRVSGSLGSWLPQAVTPRCCRRFCGDSWRFCRWAGESPRVAPSGAAPSCAAPSARRAASPEFKRALLAPCLELL